MLIDAIGLLVCLSCILPEISSFFWKSRLIYSTLDPEPRWSEPELQFLSSYAYHRKIFEQEEEQKQQARDAAQIKKETQLLEDNLARINTSKEALKWLGCIANLIRRSTVELAKNHLEHFKDKVRNYKEYLLGHLTKDSKAKDNILYNHARNAEYLRNDKIFLNDWEKLYVEDVKHFSKLAGRISAAYFKNKFPDGLFNTLFNNMMGYENPIKEKRRRDQMTTPPPKTTTKIYDEKFLKQFTIPNNADKKK